MRWYKDGLEVVVVSFSFLAFDWKVGVLVFLSLWLQNVREARK